MATYLILNLLFMVGCAVMLRLRFPRPRWPMLAGLILTLLLTAIFDSLLVGFNIVSYDHLKYLGVFIGRAPLEDFAYSILAVLLIPKLWQHFTKGDDK